MNNFYDNKLFDGISPAEFDKMIQCFSPKLKSFSAGEVICDYTDFNNNIGILQNGTANIIRIDKDGNRTILEHLTHNSVFGKTLTFSSLKDDYVTVYCEKACNIIFIGYEQLTKRCEKACKYHSILVQNTLRLLSDRAVELSRRLEILSQRSIRAKLMAFFEGECKSVQSNTFKIYFSYSDLADFLCVDRCAMMRELKKLKSENIIKSEGKLLSLLPVPEN